MSELSVHRFTDFKMAVTSILHLVYVNFLMTNSTLEPRLQLLSQTQCKYTVWNSDRAMAVNVNFNTVAEAP